ncbi:hypothetical protein [Thalassotalea sp. G2M2-11]|uniref:hypothetical protein n=1 Tax=Thalassotalea sp. G2M2-11 TaxID=2787627 RepID=UPI0019D2B830|nr:hypothetical protein [Thalassotalea sp. G2M2-11]
MITTIAQTVGKTCVVGLSYFDHQANLLKQTTLAGTVIEADTKTGITLALANNDTSATTQAAHFILPTALSCWFTAPKGDFHTSDKQVKISDPDYFVTWDIFQTKPSSNDGEHQWWQWFPRNTPPQINAQS